jgi:uncharacterized protein (DUF1684 family)
MLKNILLTLLAGVLLLPVYSFAEDEPLSHEDEVTAARERRETGLKRPNGWLTLVGLHWLEPGENSVGSADDNDIVLAGGPDHWGTVSVIENEVNFAANEGVDVTYGDGEASSGPLVADTQGEPTVVSADTFMFHVIERGSFALRVKNSEADARLSFDGLDYFPIQNEWLIEAVVERAEPGDTMEISNVLGQVLNEAMYGTIVFTVEDKEYRLDALGEEGDSGLFIIFSDRTNSHETYGAGRFLVAPMPEDGKLLIDFNRAYNPPCAFNDYSTCPLPPPQNRLNLKVTAGEQDFHAPGLKRYGQGAQDASSR